MLTGRALVLIIVLLAALWLLYAGYTGGLGPVSALVGNPSSVQADALIAEIKKQQGSV